MGIILVVVLALFVGTAMVAVHLIRTSLHNGGLGFGGQSQHGGTHLKPHKGDLRIGHNRAVNACNVLSADLTGEYFGDPKGKGEQVSESYVDSNVKPTQLPPTGTALHRLTACDRTIALPGNTSKQRTTATVRLSIDAFANKEAARRSFSSNHRFAERAAKRSRRDGTAARKGEPNRYVSVDDDMYLETQRRVRARMFQLTFDAANYTGKLSVAISHESADRSGLTLATIEEKSTKLARTTRDRVPSREVDTHPAAPPDIDGKAQLDPCRIFTSKEFTQHILAKRRGLPGYARTASPQVDRHFQMTPAAGKFAASASPNSCERASGLREYAQSGRVVRRHGAPESRAESRALVQVAHYPSAQRAKTAALRPLARTQEDDISVEKIQKLGDAAALQTDTRDSLASATMTVAKGDILLTFTERFYSTTGPQPQTLGAEQMTHVVRSMVKRLS